MLGPGEAAPAKHEEAKSVHVSKVIWYPVNYKKFQQQAFFDFDKKDF